MQLQILILAQHQFHTDQQKTLRQKGYWQILKLHSAQSEVIGWHTKSHNHFYAFFSSYCHCMRLLNANHKTNQTAQGREKSDWNEKSPNTIKCDLAFLSHKKPRPNLANSYSGRLAQLTVGTCQHLCIWSNSIRAATNTLGQQKGSHDLANSSSKIGESNTAITLSGHTAFSRYQGPEVAETSTFPWHPKQTPKQPSVSDATRKK